MRTNHWYSIYFEMSGWIRLFLLTIVMGLPCRATALGHWDMVTQAAPGAVKLILLLPDGTVMAQQAGGNNWYRLTPDIHGSYIDGTWTTLSPMIYTRDFFSSAILRDGRVFVAGGEYGTGGNKAEVYDPQLNSWTEIPVPAGLICTNCPGPGFSDSASVILPNGNVMIAPVQPSVANGTVIYNPNSNSFFQGPAYRQNQNEATWVKLPDDSILTIDPVADTNGDILNTSERYIPSLNNGQGGWIADANLTVAMYNFAQEIGAGLLLPDGRAFFIGGNGHTAYYTPSGNNSQGVWSQGPDLVSPGVGWDEPAAMMINGKVLIQTDLGPPPPPPMPQPTTFYEVDPANNSITETRPNWADNSVFSHAMLVLPDGRILVSYGNSTLRVYVPDGTPTASGKPTISSITANSNGSYHLVGTKLNGISQGSSFGDDLQNDSNYPIVRFTASNGDKTYGRTVFWSSTGVSTGNTPVSTEFVLPGNVYLGGGNSYSMEVVANGISSTPVNFISPVWVDFSWAGAQSGTFNFPYRTLAQAIAVVPSGGTIFMKGPRSSSETFAAPPISKPMTLVAIGGPVTIGQ